MDLQHELAVVLFFIKDMPVIQQRQWCCAGSGIPARDSMPYITHDSVCCKVLHSFVHRALLAQVLLSAVLVCVQRYSLGALLWCLCTPELVYGCIAADRCAPVLLHRQVCCRHAWLADLPGGLGMVPEGLH